MMNVGLKMMNDDKAQVGYEFKEQTQHSIDAGVDVSGVECDFILKMT